jgi:hypothetical protein
MYDYRDAIRLLNLIPEWYFVSFPYILYYFTHRYFIIGLSTTESVSKLIDVPKFLLLS